MKESRFKNSYVALDNHEERNVFIYQRGRFHTEINPLNSDPELKNIRSILKKIQKIKDGEQRL